MKSTQLIFEIIERFGDEDNHDLMKALKALRLQVVKEAQDTDNNAKRYLNHHYK